MVLDSNQDLNYATSLAKIYAFHVASFICGYVEPVRPQVHGGKRTWFEDPIRFRQRALLNGRSVRFSRLISLVSNSDIEKIAENLPVI